MKNDAERKIAAILSKTIVEKKKEEQIKVSNLKPRLKISSKTKKIFYCLEIFVKQKFFTDLLQFFFF